MSRSVMVESVIPEFTLGAQTAYRVTLSCGCTYWEYRPTADGRLQIGEHLRCYALHPVLLRFPSSTSET